MIVQESARGMTKVTGSKKVPTTPTTPTARQQDLDQERPSTRNTLESQHISAKYTRYLKLFKGEVGYINRLRDF